MKLTRLFAIAAVLLGVAVVWISAPAIHAADLATINLNKALARDIASYVTTDGSMAMRIKWTGTAGAGATVTVDASGHLIFTTDGSTADTTVSTDGTITVSGGTEDTFGEIAEIINGSANWACTLVAVLPSTSCNNKLTAAVLDDLEQAEGQPLYYNTADLDMVSIAIGCEPTSDTLLSVANDELLNRRSTPTGSTAVNAARWQNELLYVTTQATYTTGAPDLLVYAVKDDIAGATEILLWSDVGAATGVAKTIPILPKQAPIKAPAGYRIVVMYLDTSTADVTAGSMQVHGSSYRY